MWNSNECERRFAPLVPVLSCTTLFSLTHSTRANTEKTYTTSQWSLLMSEGECFNEICLHWACMHVYVLIFRFHIFLYATLSLLAYLFAMTLRYECERRNSSHVATHFPRAVAYRRAHFDVKCSAHTHHHTANPFLIDFFTLSLSHPFAFTPLSPAIMVASARYEGCIRGGKVWAHASLIMKNR